MQTRKSRLFRWQLFTVLPVLFGYSGYYLCRSNFSIALPVMAHELVRRGLSSVIAWIRLGTIASLGVAAYAVGKFPAGSAPGTTREKKGLEMSVTILFLLCQATS